MSTGPRYGWEPEAQQNPGTGGGGIPHGPLPRISLVIPSYNQAAYIEDTILSVLQQDYSNLELIVVDAASNDGTAAILERYRDRFAVLIQEPDNGQSEAINKGFRHASGEILGWINSDDFLLPGALRTVAELFRLHPTRDMVIGSGDVISADQQFLRHVPGRDLSADTLLGFRQDRWILQQACFWSARLWKTVGGVDESLHLLMDYDLWFRFSALTEPIVTQRKLGAMRFYPEVKTLRQSARLNSELAYVFGKNGAYEALRSLVTDLDSHHAGTADRLDHLERHPAVRVLRRLRLLR